MIRVICCEMEMKGKPVRLIIGEGYKECAVEEATHVALNFPGPVGKLTKGKMYLPVILKGKREGTNSWTWNGDVEKPTLRPSVLTEYPNIRCHTWITDGKAIFLDDCNHEFRNTTVSLLDVEG